MQGKPRSSVNVFLLEVAQTGALAVAKLRLSGALPTAERIIWHLAPDIKLWGYFILAIRQVKASRSR
jgi:hypothetical protein